MELFAAGAENPFPPIAFLYRRGVHDEIGLFDERFSVVGDWDFNLRFLSRHEIGIVDRRLANYHWRHRSGGSVYANTVTDCLEEHRAKVTALRNHYLRQDLQAGTVGLGYLVNTSVLLCGQAKLLLDVVDRGDQGIVETQKVHNRLRNWEWFFTRNRRLKAPRATQPSRNGHALGAKRAPDCRAALQALFDGKQTPPRVLSLDVFDTALQRTVRVPTDVFLLMAPALQRELGAGDELPTATLRLNAERTARARKMRSAGHEEVTLAEIHDVFCELTGADASAHRDRLMAVELGFEASVLYPDPAVAAAAQAARRAGTRVVYISDMYLPADFILARLRAAGFPAPDGALFVSSAHGASKHAGGLYEEVLQRIDCPPADIVHVGDNLHSDVEQAAAHGFRTIHWNAPSPAAVLSPMVDQLNGAAARPNFVEDDLLSSVFTGLARRSRSADGPGDIWDRLGYEVGGPLYFAYVHWLLRQSREEGRDRLFFLARDGHYLREACVIMAQQAGTPIEAIGMAASRRLLNLPQITTLDHAALTFLLTPNPNLTVRDYLARIGLDPEPLAGKIRQAGFAGADETVTRHGGEFRNEAAERAMRKLLMSLEETIVDQAAAERGRLHRYFDEIGFTPEQADKIAVVDLGWQASSASSLQNLFNLRTVAAREPHRTLRAFYFGTWQFARTAVEAGCKLSSFFFHLDKPPGRRALVAEAVELIELFFGAPHPTIIGLRESSGGAIDPVYGMDDHREEHRAGVTRMRERAVDFVRDAAALAPSGDLLGWTGNGLGYLETALDRFLRHPSPEEARLLGALPARISFGGSSPSRPIAQPPGRLESLIYPSRLRSAYQSAFWKRGFLAQLSPAAATRAQAAGSR